MENKTKSALGKNLRKGGMLGTVAALAMSGLTSGANLLESAKSLITGSKDRPNVAAYGSPNAERGKHRKAYIPFPSGRSNSLSKRRIRFHPADSGLPFDEKFGYLNRNLNGRALERYFEMVENLHGAEKAAKERAQAGFAA